jgi:hypothetical protein
MNIYMSGTLVRSTATFVNTVGTPTDPTTITLKYKAGAGSITTVLYPAAPIVRDGAGVYHADLDSTGWAGPGNQQWTTEWIGTGAVQAPGADYWEVEPLAL